MKRFLLIMAIVGVFTMSACAQKQNKQEENQMKTLVAYFSASGVTAGVAKDLAKVANADLYEIKPEVRYTDADLDWRDKQSRSTIEMKDKNSRPKIVKDLNNAQDYNLVYIGFPIWWYTAPTIINTFIESYDLSNKTIVLFATSGGSDIKKSVEDLQRTYPNLRIKGGKLLNNASQTELEKFVKENK